MRGIKLNRRRIEKICDDAQLRLEKRERLWASMGEQYELFIAAGESKPPHFRFQKLGLDPDDFPLGCYVTIWWMLKDETKLVLAAPAFYEKNHNPELTEAGKKQARINRCSKDALNFLQSRKRVRQGSQLNA